MEADWFLAVAFPDNQTQILPYNRTVKDLAGMTPDAFMAAVRKIFAVRDRGWYPSRGTASMMMTLWPSISPSPANRNSKATAETQRNRAQFKPSAISAGQQI